MNQEHVARRLRRFLLLFAAVVSIAAAVELWFEEHTGDIVQLLPFGLCAIVVLSVAAVLACPRRRVVRAHRALMLVVIAGSFFGIFKHVTENAAFEREIRPTASASTVRVNALYGASPPLAPGVLATAAILAVAGTYGCVLADGDRRSS